MGVQVMANIRIILKDGTVRRYDHEGRPGGSYTKTVRYEGAFVIVRDEYDSEVAFPAADVKEVQVNPHR